MHVFRVVLVTCLLLTLLVDVVCSAPAERAAITTNEVSEPTHMINLLQEISKDALTRKRRSFAQLHQGRRHYYHTRGGSRRYGRRFQSRRRYRLHQRGAGQVVYE